jgi:hypothetical protein
MLQYVRQLLLRGSGVQDDELQSIMNFLTTVNEVLVHYAFMHFKISASQVHIKPHMFNHSLVMNVQQVSIT